jgi:cyclohexanone monooxygenase
MGLPLEEQTPANVAAALEDADNERMAEIRARVDAVVHDPATAEKLKAWYRQICKRPCFHDEYLQSYNEPGTHLVDTDGRGVDRITETGVLAAGRHYEVDCIVFATGFEVATEYVTRAGFDVTGRAGIRLSAHWTEGMRSLHGIHVRGFPNAFLIQPVQGANFSTNVPHNLVEAADTVATVIQYTVQKGCTEVEVSASAEQAWLDLLPSGRGPQRLADCTPGTNNNEGQETAARRVGYPRGAASFFRHLGQWRSAGTFEGLEFR